jgi:hypothetical protein
MAAVGLDVSCAGAAAAFADVCGTFLVDPADEDRVADVEKLGVKPIVTPILMKAPGDAERMARTILEALG